LSSGSIQSVHCAFKMDHLTSLKKEHFIFMLIKS
jgi:hypothetical protein